MNGELAFWCDSHHRRRLHHEQLTKGFSVIDPEENNVFMLACATRRNTANHLSCENELSIGRRRKSQEP